MALSDDQRAMLRLLAQREQGYEDIAALMGLSVDEVRAKVKDALEQLEESGEAPPAPVEAEPPPAPAEVPQPEPPTPAEPAVVKAPPPAEPTPPPPPKRPPSSPPRLTMPSGKGARAAIAAGIAAIALVVVVLIVSGGDSDSTTSPTASTAAEAPSEGQSASASDNRGVTQAVLSAVDGSDASGTAVFGRVKNKLALQIEASGLAPTKQGQSYTVWLAESPQKMLPLASTQTSKAGRIGAQFEVPTEVLAYLANETFGQIDVSLTTNALLEASLAKATKEKKAPAYTGTDVLRGTITGPIVGAAKEEEEEEEEK